jgi:hypothetical protein
MVSKYSSSIFACVLSAFESIKGTEHVCLEHGTNMASPLSQRNGNIVLLNGFQSFLGEYLFSKSLPSVFTRL